MSRDEELDLGASKEAAEDISLQDYHILLLDLSRFKIPSCILYITQIQATWNAIVRDMVHTFIRT